MYGGPLVSLNDAFGWQGFPEALFYGADNALRFELAGDAQDGPLRLLRAMDRARVITSEIFASSETLTAIVNHYDGRKRTRRGAVSFKKLAEIGFHNSFVGPDRVPQYDESSISKFGEDLYCYWYTADFCRSERSMTALLWAAFARDIPVSPKVRWLERIYIADIARKIVIHPYDSRGMDVIAAENEVLVPLYERLGSWLLPYDRESMDAKFRRSPVANVQHSFERPDSIT
ncbi:DUF3885 domain-containing protein [Methylobacterium sp. sgz302541]|uniref:DUF3885 domain-containing protein n=1 Tax=unclassified Methylobacterium TaxID=2615210 RepID=UPI003D339E58